MYFWLHKWALLLMKYQISIRCLAIYVFRTYLKQQSLQNIFFKAQFQDHIFKIQNIIYSKSLQLKKKKALSKPCLMYMPWFWDTTEGAAGTDG